MCLATAIHSFKLLGIVTIIFYIILYYIILYYNLLYYIILYYIILYYIILYYIILYYIILYYIILLGYYSRNQCSRVIDVIKSPLIRAVQRNISYVDVLINIQEV